MNPDIVVKPFFPVPQRQLFHHWGCLLGFILKPESLNGK